MKSKANAVAKQYQLREWAAMVHSCQTRPAGMTKKQWLSENNISKDTFCYRLQKVREACLDQIEELDMVHSKNEIVAVSEEMVINIHDEASEVSSTDNELEINLGHGMSMKVTASTPDKLIAKVMKVAAYAK